VEVLPGVEQALRGAFHEGRIPESLWFTNPADRRAWHASAAERRGDHGLLFRAGCTLNAFYVCYHEWVGQLRVSQTPPGMLLAASRDSWH